MRISFLVVIPNLAEFLKPFKVVLQVKNLNDFCSEDESLLGVSEAC